MTQSDAETRNDARQNEIAISSAWQPVLAHFDYNSGFAFGLILAPNAASAEDCQRALTERLSLSGKKVLDISPDSPDSLKQIAGRLLSLEIGEEVAAVWIAAVVTESSSGYEAWSSAWREGLARLNQFRNRLQRHIPCSLLFVGAPWVQPVMRTMAPDIWSVRSWVTQISSPPVSHPQRSTGRVRDAVSASTTLQLKNAPDPEFALQEAEQLRSRSGQELSLADILYRAGTGFEARGEFARAAEVLQESLILRSTFGTDPKMIANSEIALANALISLGHWEQAREHYRKAAELYTGERDQMGVLDATAGLASILWWQGDLEGARKLEEEVLAARRRVLGADHPDTLTSMGNLAATLSSLGDLEGARKMEEEVLAMRRVLGAEHPDTLTAMGNLAETLRSLGDLEGARKTQEEVLAATRRVLGAEHPDTLTSMNNLAVTLRSQGDLEGARQMQEEVLAAGRRVLGAEHPDTLTSMNNLAGTLRSQGDLEGARKMQEEVLAARRRVLGAEHPDTLISMNNLAETLRSLGDAEGARKLEEEKVR